MRESDAASRAAVAFVTVLVEAVRPAVGPMGEFWNADRVQELVDRAVENREMTEADLVGALGLLAARAVEDLARSSGECVGFWLQRWLAEPFG